MSHLANLNGVSKALPGIINPKANIIARKRGPIITGSLEKKKKNNDDSIQVQTTRRLALGLASIALVGNATKGTSLAEDNGWWITSPLLPNPTVDNKITNEKTGTRSFIKKGLYMADIGDLSRIYRIRKCAFDLLAMEDLIDKDKLNYVQKFLRYKSTSMYFDFDRVISAAKADDKQPLLDLANKLFDNVEELEAACRRRNIDQTEAVYKDTKVILEEVMKKMSSIYKTV